MKQLFYLAGVGEYVYVWIKVALIYCATGAVMAL
ncbi:uncharacterized protein METZ01_LOCUS290774 [marine metagenome]|uniref:Uncharacterized protein n=1 Tax=marine metagenome TaxID=408172 RepID=A0A382LMR0_9ZZZZ